MDDDIFEEEEISDKDTSGRVNLDKKSPPPKLDSILIYLEQRFGITKQSLDELQFAFYLGTQGKIFLGPKNALSNPKIATIGLLCFRAESAIKPSSIFFQIIGDKIKKNFIKINKKAALKFLIGYDLLENEFDSNNSEEGYVLVKYYDGDTGEEFSLGCALLKNRSIRNTLPKAKRLEVEYI